MYYKRKLCFFLVLIVALMGTLAAETIVFGGGAPPTYQRDDELIEVQIGAGVNANNTSNGSTPYMGYYRNYRMHNLIKASEIVAAGGVPGHINAIAYEVSRVNNYAPMPNYRIRLKHTTLESFSSFFQTGEYTQVFSSNTYMPTTGWSVHEFSTPFLWDGHSNIIIETITGMAGSNSQNASVYYNNPGYNSTIIYANNANSAENATSGNVSYSRPNVKLLMSLAGVPDMSANAVNGPRMPNMGSENIYRVTVRNLSPNTVDDYQVKLMRSTGVELASVAGPAIEPLEVLEVNVPWTPTQLGTMQIYGKVDMPGDEFPDNDNSPNLSIEVIPAGYELYQLGYGGGTNGNYGGPSPYGTRTKAFREQYLIKPSELFSLGGSPGYIYSTAWNVLATNGCLPMPNYRIRLKHTTQNALTTTFEPGEYTVVFHEDGYVPTVGWNEHEFSSPFLWNGYDNLIIDISSDLITGDPTYNATVPSSVVGFVSSLRFTSNTVNGSNGLTGSIEDFRPNLRLRMMGIELGSLTGVVTEAGLPVENVRVSIEDSDFICYTNAEGEYLLGYAPAGEHTVIAEKHGYETVSHVVVIEENQEATLDFEIMGLPEFEIDTLEHDFGNAELAQTISKDFHITNLGGGELIIQSIETEGHISFELSNIPTLPITLRSEEIASFRVNFTPYRTGEFRATVTITDNLDNGTREEYQIALTGYGLSTFTLGEGMDDARIPFNFGYQTSVFQTILTRDELSGFIGQISGVKLYNAFDRTISDTPIKLYLGITEETDLADGWISAADMQLVFDASITFPSNSTVSINFPEPFNFFDDGNLVMLFHRPLDNGWYNANSLFKTQTWGETRSRYDMTDFSNFLLDNLTGGTLTGEFPKMTIFAMPGNVGFISGHVKDESGNPLAGVGINMQSRNLAVTDSNGNFEISTIMPDEYLLSFVYHGYHDYEMELAIEEGDELELEITMIEMEKVPVSGVIVAADTQEGIEGAVLNFSGYDSYEAITIVDGSFELQPGVYANFSYDYTISANGYSLYHGNIEVGESSLNMGTIALQELAYAPTMTRATITPDHSAIEISWNAPDPDAIDFAESFEDAEFPPAGWSQLITNTGAANQLGLSPTWGQVATVDFVQPSDGVYQAGFSWDLEHQDEWLFSPNFSCPADAYLSFDTYLNLGSEGGDHYYVKISDDGGLSWNILWDGANLPPQINNYSQPITLDLSDYAGHVIQLAWHGDDGADNQGMWYDWFIDNVFVNSIVRGEAAPLSLAKTSDRAFVGYKIWRLQDGQQDAENNWVALSDEILVETEFTDTDWATLAHGEYLWAVKAVYSADLHSNPAFSNIVVKESNNGTISGFVRNSVNSQGIAGATVSAGDGFETTTIASGFYSLSLPAGSYSVMASHDEYDHFIAENIVVISGENTTLNFTLYPVSNEDVVEIAATALRSNYPNPFNPTTTISYDLKEPGKVRLGIFNLKGQLVRTMVNKDQASGRYKVVFEAKDGKGNRLSSGLYFYRLTAGDYSKTRKMMLME